MKCDDPRTLHMIKECKVKEVYDNYEFLRRLTEKRFSDMILADEAYSYAFDKLVQDDWRRVRAYKGKSSFRYYLGCVWCRLLEDFAIMKYGKITPPQWVKKLGSEWEELFKSLCRQRYSIDETVETMIGRDTCAWDAKMLENAARQIVARIPNCGHKRGPAFSFDDDQHDGMANQDFFADHPAPDDIAINKERWIALQAMANVFFSPSASNFPNENEMDDGKLVALIRAIRERVRLNEEEQLMLTAHFIDGEPISMLGRRLGRNQNQIHGQFRRLKEKIKTSLTGLLEAYL